ncbi:MAG TPA: ATP-dependent zinc metalloprotease FtsH [Candidatus Borkfalkia avistercoris]|uniref:ATP-dependent zinc metalloprotease FtsH n=1 Tax=Candidatus Borkfalkia avistercoris TaxID=2838504 RepID=A0A9D2CYU7_9FIRM|nr:ATP-dependent zinc metalloprotease FtsH [Candidatus Borkfalkia avistercoris]
MSKTAKIVLWTILGIVLIIILVSVLTSMLSGGRTIDSSEVGGYVQSGEIDRIVVDDYNLICYKNGRVVYEATFGRSDEEIALLISWANNANLNFTFTFTDPNAGSFVSYLIPIIGVVLVCVVFWLLIRQTQGGGSKAMSFAKTKARVNSNIKVRFSDVAGAEEEKQELAEVVEFLKAPRKFADLGARIPKGVLLVGPPGTGKTLFAKAVAGEANVPFFSISGSDFVEMFVGVGASRVRDLFDAAKKSQPCIVFIDEIDAVGRQRGTGLGGGHDEREQTLNQLLVQMDGFETNEGIIVMAATNRADILDPALLRPGRFDRQIHVNLPDVRGREAILKVHARNKPLAPDVNFKILSRMTSGFSGADLENLLNEAAILTARANKKMIGNKELFEGINKVLLGPQKKSRLVTEADKRITAYHESGHAIIAKLCKHCDPVQEVSIIARGMAAGYTMTRPDNDDNHMTKAKLTDLVCELLGGRVAEELVIKDVSTGASNDLQRVTEIARKMVTEWGMSERVGLVTYSSDNPIFLGRDMETHNSYSEETAGVIDEEVHKIIEAAHERAVKLLTENRKVLDNMARVLIERETIYTEEVDMLLEGATVSEVYEHMDKFEKAEAENPFKRFESVAEEVKAAESAAKTPEQASAPKEEPAQAPEAASDGQAEKEDGSGKGPQETTDDTDDKGGKQQ